MENVKSVGDLDRLNVADLKAFLGARGVRKTGNKETLLKLARIYFRCVKMAIRVN